MIRSWNGNHPRVDDTAYIHESAEVIGKVTIGRNASVWPNAVIRGDIEEIILGDRTNIQDSTVIHTDPGTKTVIGEDVSVGHSVILHSCTVHESCLIGMGSIILEGAVIGKESLVAAGALVSPGKVMPEKSLIIGMPAKVKRELTPEEIDGIRKNAALYLRLAESHRRTE